MRVPAFYTTSKASARLFFRSLRAFIVLTTVCLPTEGMPPLLLEAEPCTAGFVQLPRSRETLVADELRRLGRLPKDKLKIELAALSPNELIYKALRGMQLLSDPRRATHVSDAEAESAFPEVILRLAKTASQKATPEERTRLVTALLGRVERAEQTWEDQHLLNELIDAVSGLETRKVDQAVQQLPDDEVARRYGREQTWFRFGNRDLLTPYFEYLNILHKLDPKPGQRIVLIGAGVGREAIPTAIRYPGVAVTGYEIVAERVKASQDLAKRMALKGVTFHEQNLADKGFKPEAADYYYAFNPVSGETFDKVLSDIKSTATKEKRPFTIVVSGPAAYEKFTRPGSGFKEIHPKERFADDDFARYFRFDPAAPQEAVATRNLASTVAVPQYPQTRPLTREDRKLVEEALAKSPTESSHVTFGALWSWHGTEDYHLTKILNLPVLTNRNGSRQHIEPLSGTPEEKAAAIRFAIAATVPGEAPPVFHYVSERVADLLRKNPDLKVEERPQEGDYIYQTKTLAKLEIPETQESSSSSRKDIKDKKKQAESFAVTHPDVKYVAFTEGSKTYDEVKEFLKDWGDRNGERIGREGKNEVAATETMLAHMGEMGFEARAIVYKEKIVAFSLGKKTSDSTFVIYAQKSIQGEVVPGQGRAEHYGIVPYFFSRQAEELEKAGVAQINLQDDGGNEGLKRMKKQMAPLKVLRTFTVTKK